MKYPFLKAALTLGTALALVNCVEDGSVSAPNGGNEIIVPTSSQSSILPSNTSAVATEACWLLNADQTYLIGASDMMVKNAFGSIVGIYDPNSKAILNTEGNVLIAGVELDNLIVLNEGDSYTAIYPSSSASAPVLSSASVVPQSSAAEIIANSSAANDIPASSSAIEAKSSATASTEIVDGSITITGSLDQTVAQLGTTSEIKVTGLTNEPSRLSWNAYFLETSYSDGTYIIKAITVPEYFEVGEVSEFFKINGKDYEFKLNITAKNGSAVASSASTGKSSASQQSSSSATTAKSSSSKATSSASQQSSSSVTTAKSSSSTATSSAATATSSYSYGNTAAATEIKYVSGGRSGSGFASRYWDCCKPSCAWGGKGGLKARACSVSGSYISDDNATSTCNSGSAGTCVSQIPMVVNDNLAYAYAAVPAKDGGQCGKCFALEFTGKGKYETKANHKALAGKTLIVMASNVGEDVAQGQFDVMIPGGGVGLYNGCSAYGWGNMGAQYGGLLTECEKSAGSSGDLRAKRKACLAEKCETTFSNDATAKEGCMFLATWMEAAGNPTHTYKEVECPAALTAKY